MDLSAEVVSLLRDLIRARSGPHDTEAAAADILVSYLRKEGIEPAVYEAEPGRTNVVARVRGRGSGPSLLLLSHLDTVDADPMEWSADPWGGEVRNGNVWGRGALDLKGQTAAQAVALASLVREGAVLRGDVVLAATADEEHGSDLGTRWLTRVHPDLLRTDYALTHGAGDRVVLDDRIAHFCANAERAKSALVVTLEVPAGLTMLPDRPNVITAACAFVARMAGQHPGERLLADVATVVRELAGSEPQPAELIGWARAEHPALGTLLTPLTGATVVPTRIEASSTAGRRASCRIEFDCWLLPGQERREVENLIAAAVGEMAYETSWTPQRGGSRSPIGTALWRSIEAFIDSVDPGGVLLPLCDAGFTDSHWLREAYGTTAYGIFPMREMTTTEAARYVHGPDEHTPIADLELQVAFYRHVISALGGDHAVTPSAVTTGVNT